ncbi:MAG TPA: anhydro-N-acetylmuramic acid kinase, partial [Edaphobacter sp.]
VKLIGHVGFRYPKALRAGVLAAMDAKAMAVADMSRLHWRLGEVYADAVEAAAKQFGVKVELVGCHGQTVYHQAAASRFLGSDVRCTWQIGEASVIAERMRVPVVSDFRPADLAAGGQGAPLVPMLDYVMFRSAKVSRVLQNLGGIGNLTAIPAGGSVDAVMAFDTGPGNMVIDGCMAQLFGRGFDRGGAVARRGRVIDAVVERILREEYFSALPPKSCGREEFGEGFVTRFIAMCRKAEANDADVVATATALTARSIVDAYRRFVRAHLEQADSRARVEYVVAGGGARNETLLRMLREGLQPLGVKMRSMEELGVPAQAKEGVAFALLAWLTWFGIPGNVPSATGAKRAVVLGKVTRG